MAEDERERVMKKLPPLVQVYIREGLASKGTDPMRLGSINHHIKVTVVVYEAPLY
jgi:hypothetical protein